MAKNDSIFYSSPGFRLDLAPGGTHSSKSRLTYTHLNSSPSSAFLQNQSLLKAVQNLQKVEVESILNNYDQNLSFLLNNAVFLDFRAFTFE